MGHLHRLIAFDLDGTLIDSSRDVADSANDLIQELGGTPLATDTIVAMVGEGAGKLVERALETAHLPTPPDALARFLAFYDQRLLNHIVPDYVHVLSNGQIVATGDKSLALKLEEEGYDWIRDAPAVAN